MARHTSVLLGDHYQAFVDGQVASGHYASASEVMREALRLLERRKRREAREAATVRALIAAEESGFEEGDLFGDLRAEFGLPPRG